MESLEKSTAQMVRELTDKIKRYSKLGDARETGPEFDELNREILEAQKDKALFDLAEIEARQELLDEVRGSTKEEKK